MPSNEETVRTGHSACSTSSAVSTIDQLTDEDMTKYTVKVGIVVVDIAEINIVDIVYIDVDICRCIYTTYKTKHTVQARRMIGRWAGIRGPGRKNMNPTESVLSREAQTEVDIYLSILV